MKTAHMFATVRLSSGVSGAFCLACRRFWPAGTVAYIPPCTTLGA